jgi:hypothetical protein
MWKIIYTINIILLIFICTFAKANTADNHPAKLNGKFLYVLLGDDDGVLSESDLATNAY